MEKAFIMHKSCRIILTIKFGHLKDIFSTKGLISTGPDQDCRVVFVTLVHGIYTIQHHTKPFRFVMRNNICVVSCKFCHIPGTMRFQIVFRDHIKAVLITEAVDRRGIRIMAGTDGIDVVLLHSHNILDQFLTGYVSSCDGTELVTVHTFEHNTFSVEGHNAVFHFKAAETNFFRNNLLEHSVLIIHFHVKVIKIRFFRTPEQRIQNFPCTGIFTVQSFFILQKDLAFSGKYKFQFSFSPGFCHDLKTCFFKGLIRDRTDLKIIDMNLRHGIKINISVNSGKAEKVLVFAPAAGCPFEYLGCQFVLALFQILCKLKF